MATLITLDEGNPLATPTSLDGATMAMLITMAAGTQSTVMAACGTACEEQFIRSDGASLLS
jgi:hypothetical protein